MDGEISCMYCNRREYNIMKIHCNHYICIFCYDEYSRCYNCNKEILKKPEKKEQKVNRKEVTVYDTMYEYDNNII